MARNSSVTTRTVDKPYEPTPLERKALDSNGARPASPAPRMKVTQGQDETQNIAPDHPDQVTAVRLLLEATGTKDFDFLNGLVGQLATASASGPKVQEGALNFMLAVVKGIGPRDQTEAMLAAQMAATHQATMTFAHRLARAQNIPQQDSAERAFNKLARTFAAQIEALKRYRSAGEQTVRVEQVTVNEGGQAIVGNVAHGGRASPEKTDATP